MVLARIPRLWLITAVTVILLLTAYFNSSLHTTSTGTHDPTSRFLPPYLTNAPPTPHPPKNTRIPPNSTKAFIVASTTHDNITWLSSSFPLTPPPPTQNTSAPSNTTFHRAARPADPAAWQLYQYVNDDPHAPLTVPHQNGRESSAYLTFIIDHYDALPDFMIFIHPQRYQWHNEDPMYDGLRMLKGVNLDYVMDAQYTSLRCTHSIGCPSEILAPELHPADEEHPDNVKRKTFAQLWRVAFGGDDAPPLPDDVGAPCCSQFAVTKAAVRANHVDVYRRVRWWLQEGSGLFLGIAGRTMEYFWHVLFHKPPVSCPDAGACFCNLYGLCGLRCPDRAACEGRYILPPFWVKLPEEWPQDGPGKDGLPMDGWWREKDGMGGLD